MNILEDWDISHFKDDILIKHAESSNPFLWNIRERNKSKTIWDIRFQDTNIVPYLNILRSDTPFQFAYISAPDYRTEKFLYSRRSYGSHLSQLSSIFVAIENKQKPNGQVFSETPFIFRRAKRGIFPILFLPFFSN